MKKVVMCPGPWHPMPPIKGAAVETWIYEVAKRILKYQIYIFSIGSPFHLKREVKEGVFFYRINIGRIYNRIFKKLLGWDVYSYNDRLFRLIKEINPHIVHLQNHYASKDLILEIRKKLPATKIVLHMHNISSKIDSSFPRLDAFVGVSNFITEHYKSFLKADLFKTIYNGIDLEKFLAVRKRKKDLKRRIQKTSTQKNIFFVGRISPEKGVEKFVRLANLCKDIKELKFFCVGEISTKGDKLKYYQELINFIKREKLENIEFWDWVSPFKIHMIYPMADLIVIPSKVEEAFGLVALEAMAAGVPVIAAAKGGMKEYLKDGENAIVIEDYENFETIAKENLLDLLQSPKKMKKLSANALKLIATRFTWEKVAEEVENFYAELTL